MKKNNNINIAEILKDCPEGMKLYSPLFGEVKLNKSESDNISIFSKDKGPYTFDTFSKNGYYYSGYSQAECLLFPSSEMRDWSKFFKRGDVLCHKDGNLYVVFESWANDDYTEFNTTDISFGKVEVCNTDFFVKASDAERAVFIANAERTLKGKYNPDTLQVEPVKIERPLKPFDKVLVRDDGTHGWYANFFSHYRENDEDYPYACIDSPYHYCIPYNEHTAHLLGTTDPYTEGGSK